MELANPFVPIGLALSALAAVGAFLITYKEWSHHYPSKREPLEHALEAGAVAFLVFATLVMLTSVLIGLLARP
ncbi:MAG: hypothetical protein K6U00_12340 [Armatimonadetes bacterium]|nr:hypothetical protein [Armatimonadota bacterium]